jgi:GNAT superfamily N-acetyltransferase
MMQCRAATFADADAIAALHADSWQTTYRGAMRDAYLDGDVVGERRAVWHERLTTPASNQHVIVAEAAGAVVGFACVYGGADATWGTELDNLHVRRGAQSRGIGARLVAAVARWAAAAHPDAGLYLWVLDGNHGARRFYARLDGRDAEGSVWNAPDGSALAVRRIVWSPSVVTVLATPPGITIAPATTGADYAVARGLFEEYAAWLQVDLCFQGFAAELDDLPAMYGPPSGCLLVARRAGTPVACVGVRRLSGAGELSGADDTCEMKRLFVRDGARGLGLGWQLAAAAVAAGRRHGYRRMVLDTLEPMAAARRVYAGLGFVEVDAYYANPLPGVRYMAVQL